MKEKPRVFRAIMSALLGLVIFGIVYFLVFIIYNGIIYVLTLIPLVKNIVNWLFQVRGDSPDMVATFLAALTAYYATKTAVVAISKAIPTRRLSLMIVGACLVVVHVISLGSNLVHGEWILPNIVQAVAGAALFFSGKNKPSE